MFNVIHILEFFVFSTGAESGPPLGTALGNLGLNTVKFCKEFNDFTKDLPLYFNVKVRIYVYDNRSFTFVVFRPSSSYILSLVKFEKIISTKTSIGLKNLILDGVIFLHLLKLSLFVFPNYKINNIFKICWSTLSSLDAYLFSV